MLLQSHAGELHLLPGVDFGVWPDGAFRGLRARGGFEVSARWAGRVLIEAELLSLSGLRAELRSTRRIASVTNAQAEALPLSSTQHGTVRFATSKGERYTVHFD
jgi:alpha-L-fucosidase 2